MVKHDMPALVRQHMRYESDDAIARFERLVNEGFEPAFAAMHASGSYPGVVGTDTQFRQGNHKKLDKTPAMIRRELVKRRGYSGNAVYHNQLGEWVESVDDIKRAARRKNKTVEDPDTGKVLHQGHYVPEARPGLAESVVHSRMVAYATENPSLVATPAKIKKLREDVINKHTPHWRKKGTVIE